jgi:hypothetical protein
MISYLPALFGINAFFSTNILSRRDITDPIAGDLPVIAPDAEWRFLLAIYKYVYVKYKYN